MRYHWGLGVGHLHAHQPSSISIANLSNMQDDQSSNSELEASGGTMQVSDKDSDCDSNNAELGLEDRHLADEGWQDEDTEGSNDLSGSDLDDTEDESFTGI